MAKQYHYSLPDQGVMAQFVENVALNMKLKVAKEEVDQITSLSGSWFWFVKGILRLRQEDGKRSIDELAQDASIDRMIEIVWLDLPDQYKQILFGQISQKSLLEEMKIFGIIDQEGRLIGGLMRQYLGKQQDQKLVITADKIEFNFVNLNDRFSKGERSALAKLKLSSSLVPRDELAKLLWEGDVAYEVTDWALDQKMRRLRQKIAKLGLPIVITTKKGEGYGIT
jgi:hypothetical protein